MARLRFWEHIDKTATCWLWTGYRDKDGYGGVNARGEALAHRLSWVLHRGQIPSGLTIDHLCRIRHCVNPDHLQLVTKGENTRRGIGPTAIHARQAACVHGHPFDEANTYRRQTKYGVSRTCRTCNRAAVRRYAARQAVLA